MAEITRQKAFVAAPTPVINWQRVRHIAGRILIFIVLSIGALIFAAPFIWLVSSSLKEPSKIWVFPPQLIPNPIRWANYTEALSTAPFARYTLNTLIIV